MTANGRRFATVILFFTVACGGGDKGGTQSQGGTAAGGAPATTAAAPATGKVIEVEMTTDENGSYFKPSKLAAHPGDVIRFKLETGVHNVHFVADSNPGVPNLPAASDMLQLPGQTFDFTVPAAAGKTLFFRCDPHALLGMVGYLKVEG